MCTCPAGEVTIPKSTRACKGKQDIVRFCRNPAPQNGGLYCLLSDGKRAKQRIVLSDKECYIHCTSKSYTSWLHDLILPARADPQIFAEELKQFRKKAIAVKIDKDGKYSSEFGYVGREQEEGSRPPGPPPPRVRACPVIDCQSPVQPVLQRQPHSIHHFISHFPLQGEEFILVDALPSST
jgi:hypothetical protein